MEWPCPSHDWWLMTDLEHAKSLRSFPVPQLPSRLALIDLKPSVRAHMYAIALRNSFANTSCRDTATSLADVKDDAPGTCVLLAFDDIFVYLDIDSSLRFTW